MIEIQTFNWQYQDKHEDSENRISIEKNTKSSRVFLNYLRASQVVERYLQFIYKNTNRIYKPSFCTSQCNSITSKAYLKTKGIKADCFKYKLERRKLLKGSRIQHVGLNKKFPHNYGSYFEHWNRSLLCTQKHDLQCIALHCTCIKYNLLTQMKKFEFKLVIDFNL